jgi:hypothetical protein
MKEIKKPVRRTAKNEDVLAALVWNAEKVALCREDIENGVVVKHSPFWEGQPEWRQGNIVYEYAQWEQDEIQKCANDVIYFANNYCHVMTDEGIQNITLRDYQWDILKEFIENRFSILLSPRQSGKCYLFNVQVVIYDYLNNKFRILSMGEFYFEQLSLKRKLTLIETIKQKLYVAYTILTRDKVIYNKIVEQNERLQDLWEINNK